MQDLIFSCYSVRWTEWAKKLRNLYGQQGDPAEFSERAYKQFEQKT